MYRETGRVLFGVLIALGVIMSTESSATMSVSTVPVPGERIELAKWLAAGKLKAVNREVTKLQGRDDAVHVNEKSGPGIVWIEGTDFAEGTLQVNVHGRDVFQKSFLGIAFHGKDDNTYEAVYVRPFNFRASDPDRHKHAVQYVALPQYDWPRLRQEFPDEFERPVDASVAPGDWVQVRIVVSGASIQVYVGAVKSPTLTVRKLGQQERGKIGLWTGNNSDGDFADLQIIPMK